MASIFDRNGNYYCQFYDSDRSPQRKRFSLHTSDKGEARQKVTELEQAAEEGEFDPWTDDPFNYRTPERAELTILEAVRQFCDAKEREGCAENTIKTYRGTWRRFARIVGEDATLSDLTVSEFHEYIHDPSIADSTRHNRFRHIRTVLKWAGCEAHLEKIDAPRRPDKLPTPIRKDELAAICDGLKCRYRRLRSERKTRKGVLLWAIPAFRFAFYTGLRASEIGRLKWKDIRTDRDVIRLRDTKSGGEQTVPLIGPAKEALSDAPSPRGSECYVFRSQDGPLRDRNEKEFARQLSRTFKKAREETDISSEKTLHDLRAGFATALADAGMGAHQIKEAMRHADISTSLKYVRVSRQKLRSEMENAF